MTAEIGRQPWVVFGLLRTSAGASPAASVPAGTGIFTLLGFMGLYLFARALYLVLILRIVAQGPDEPAPAARRGTGGGGGRRMTTAWFCLLAVMVAMYVVLDGFDLGVGALHLIVARTEEEREHATEMIGPVWNGNEVWLIAAGGVLFLAFPPPMPPRSAASTSGSSSCCGCWSAAGWRSSCATRSTTRCGAAPATRCSRWPRRRLRCVFGVALGNVVRGVPLEADGYFSLPLFHMLNWYALLIGFFGLIVLARARRQLPRLARGRRLARRRAARAARRLWPVVAVLGIVLAWPTYHVRHQMLTAFGDHPWRLVFPLLATAALVGRCSSTSAASAGWPRSARRRCSSSAC